MATLILLGSFITYYRVNKTYYIDYTERGNVEHKVKLKENEFYDSEWADGDQAYIATLIDSVVADFDYELTMATEGVDYEYAYRIEAQLNVIDNDSDVAIFDPVYSLKDEQRATQSSSNKLEINEQIVIDYARYNDIADRFVKTYDLNDTTSYLSVRMHIDVVGYSDQFQEDSENEYVVALNIPLTSKTVNIEMTSTVPDGESKVLACYNGVNRNIFLIASIVSGSIDGLLIIVLIAFVFLTRNEDINYAIKVRKLVSSYRSYIQQISNGFDTNGYQILMVKTFTEMLGIRDTIQSPILMSENADQTCTQFIIPTNTKILYLYEVKVEDYDRIYGAPAEESEEVEEVILVSENVDEEAVAEAMAAPDVELSKIDFVDEIDEEYASTEEKPGVEVIGVVWPERPHKNKIYRYDPNGEDIHDGDVVLVPSRDVASNKDVIRKAAVAHGNHTVDPETLKYPLKKIIGVVKHKAASALTGMLSKSGETHTATAEPEMTEEQ